MPDRIKVLAVDDAPANLMVLKGCLRGEEFELTTCTNALDGLQQFKEKFFDVLLLDVIMPGIDGFELRKLIREVDKERPIIFLTAMVDDGDMRMLKSISWDPCTFYLNKVVDKINLITKIKEVVHNHRTRQIEKMHSDKLASELKLAGELQRLLLPEWCELEGQLGMSYYYRPVLYVSGDILELFQLRSGKQLLFIGDIAGHGVSAALYMATILSWLKVVVNADDIKPDELFNRLNRFFCKELRGAVYMTALAAVIDWENHHVVLHTAGHPALAFYEPGLKALTFSDENSGSLPVGWMETAEYSERDNWECDITDDTVILGMTDGVFDIENEAGKVVSKEELNEIISTLMEQADWLTLPYQLRSTLEYIGYTDARDDVLFVSLVKRRVRPNFVERMVAPKLSAVEPAAEALAQVAGDDLELRSRIDLLAHEYLNNVIIHGAEGANHTPDNIYVSIGEAGGELVFRGADRADSFDPAADPGQSQAGAGEPAMNGRGIQIIRELTKYMAYNTYSGLNESCFALKPGEPEKLPTSGA